jgi:WD40 repeat protein
LRQTLVKDSPEAVAGLPTRWQRAWVAGTRSSLDGCVTAVACAPGADLIAVGDRSGSLRLYRRSGELIAERHTGRTADLMEMTFGHHAGRPYLASIDRGNVLQLWDGADGSPLTSMSLTGRRGSHLSLFSIGGRLIASVTGDRWRGVLIDMASGQKIAKDEFDEHPIVYLHGRPVIVTTDPHGDLQVIEGPSPTRSVTATSGTAPSRVAVRGLAVSGAEVPGSAASGVAVPRPAASGVAVPGSAASGVEVPGIAASGSDGPPSGKSVVCFHSGDRLLAGVIHAHEVAIWDVAERQVIDVLLAPAPVAALAATSDGDLILLAGGEAVFMAHQLPSTDRQRPRAPQPDSVP